MESVTGVFDCDGVPVDESDHEGVCEGVALCEVEPD